MSGHHNRVSDSGLQPERTGLAWQRTALAAAACALFLLHGAARQGWGSATVPAVVAAATATGLAVTGAIRQWQLRSGPRPLAVDHRVPAAVAVMVALTAASTLLSAC